MSEENVTPETPAVEAPAAPAPGTPEYNAQLAAEGSVAMGNVPDKFKGEDGTVDVNAMAAAYRELEKQFHAPKDEPVPTPVQEEPSVPAEPEAPVEELRVPDEPEVVEEVVEKDKSVVTDEELAGFTSEIMRSGDISEVSRIGLLERGIPASLIDSMVAGQRAKMRDQYTRASDIVGSQDRLSKIFGWAAKNLDDGQRAAINAGLAGSASEATLLGLAGMYDKAAADAPKTAEPREAPRYASNPSGRETIVGFTSKQEYYAATNDPGKMADPKYRAEVEAKMIRTDWSTLG